MSVNGIGKQVAPAVDCTTHDCFILMIRGGAIDVSDSNSYNS